MRILIIDNEPELRSGLRQLITSMGKPGDLLEEAEGVVSGLEKIAAYDPELVFLDIEMEDGTGFDLLRQLSNPPFQLIFTTAHNQYAIQAFKFSAMDYLLKPIDPGELASSLEKARAHITKSDLNNQLAVLMQQLSSKPVAEKKIVLKDIESTYFVKISDILYCEAGGTYTKFYIEKADPILVSKNLKEYEAILEPHGFLRTHHSYLLNPDKIKMYDKTDGGALILVSGHSIPVSQRKKEMILQILENR
jgi:two-component system, LytTR family, response regulator